MTTVFVFPGQGSQRVGMGLSLFELRAARDVFDLVDDALGRPLSRLMHEGPTSELTLTRNAQPALMAVSVAAVRALEQEMGRPLADVCRFVAGHSLGEYAALTATGALDIATAARLLHIRGEAMQSAVAAGDGAMAAIMGLEIDTVAALVAAVDGPVDVANDNAAGQIVISGALAAVEEATAMARREGAKRVTPLPVSAPFHCRLMAPAAERMAAALAEVEMQPPAVPVIANVTAAPVSAVEDIRPALVEQVCGRVRWRETMAFLARSETRLVVEAGAGRVLSGLAKRAVPGAQVTNLETADDVRRLALELAR